VCRAGHRKKIFEALWLAWSMLSFANESDFSEQFQRRLRLSEK